MTEELQPIAAADPEATRVLVRGLVPRAIFELICLGAGVAAFLATGEVFWIVGAAIVGAAPMTFYVLSWAMRRKRISTTEPRPRNIVE